MNPLLFEDAWVFLGMKCAENAVPDYYVNLVGFFDYINHSIPTYEQFITAFNKLLYLSVINKVDGRIAISDFGNVIYLKALGKSGPNASPREIAELVFAELRTYKLKSACRQTPLSAQEYAEASKLYLAKK